MATSYEDFLTEQERVYAKFKGALASLYRSGVTPDPVVAQHKRGFLVALRHDPGTAGEIERVSDLITDMVPGSVRYRGSDAHITLTDYGVHAASEEPPFPQTDAVIAGLARAVRTALATVPRETRAAVGVDYADLLGNQQCVIAAGTPNQEWFLVREAVLAACRGAGYDVKGSWGAHSAVARFGREIRSPDTIALYELLSPSMPVRWKSRPKEIVVGFFVCQRNEFVVGAAETIQLA